MVLASAYFPTLSIQASDSRACTNRGAAWAIRSIALIDRAVGGASDSRRYSAASASMTSFWRIASMSARTRSADGPAT